MHSLNHEHSTGWGSLHEGTRAGTGRAARRRRGGRLRLVGLMIAPLAFAGLLRAQGADGRPSTRTVASPAGSPEALDGIAGLRPDMTHQELLDWAEVTYRAGKLLDAQKVLAYLSDQPLVQPLTKELLDQRIKTLGLLADIFEKQAAQYKTDQSKAGQDKTRGLEDGAVQAYVQAGQQCLVAAQYGDEQEMYKLAEDNFGRALAYREKNAGALLGIARLFAATNRSLLAIDRYRKYFDCVKQMRPKPDPQDLAQAYLELGRVYRTNKYFGQAVTVLQTAKSLHSENAEIQMELALAYLESDRVDTAVTTGKQAVTQASIRADYHRYLDQFARILLRQARQAKDNERKAIIQQADDHVRRAIDHAHESLRKDPDQPLLLQSLAGYYDTQQEVMQARLQRDPEDIDAKIDLARSIYDRAAVWQAARLHVALGRLPPAEGPQKDNVKLLELRAELEHSILKLRDARATCQQILALDPENKVAKRILERIPRESQEPPATTDKVQ